MYKHSNNGQRECQGKSVTKWRSKYCADLRLNNPDKCYLITHGVPWGTVPELFFEKKQLIPALQ